MNEDQKQILAEAIIKAFEIIERNLMKVIDEKFDAIMDGKGEADDPVEVIIPLSEDDVRSIAADEARDIVNSATVDISA
jgi:vacuolar-type H+-ATPase subunit H